MWLRCSAFEKPEGEDFLLDSENEELFSIGITSKKKRKVGKGFEKAAGKGSKEELKRQKKIAHRPKINILKIMTPEFYDLKSKTPNYMTLRSSPSLYPAHKYCSVCGYDCSCRNVVDLHISTSARDVEWCIVQQDAIKRTRKPFAFVMDRNSRLTG